LFIVSEALELNGGVGVKETLPWLVNHFVSRRTGPGRAHLLDMERVTGSGPATILPYSNELCSYKVLHVKKSPSRGLDIICLRLKEPASGPPFADIAGQYCRRDARDAQKGSLV
jgi:hypothetical protein